MLVQGFSNTGLAYGVVVLESAPKFYRGFAVSGMKSSMPLPVQAELWCCITMKNCGNRVLELSDYSQAYATIRTFFAQRHGHFELCFSQSVPNRRC